jgi:hypothetical protein
MLSPEPASGYGRITGNREVGNSLQSPYCLTNEIAESVSDEGSADRSRCGAYGGVLLACQGKFPIHQLQKASQFAILLLKILDPKPQRRHYILPRRALSIP